VTPELKERLEGLAQAAKPTQEQLDQLIQGWDTYFRAMNIKESEQENEFSSFMRMRISIGCISIVAPDMDEISMLG